MILIDDTVISSDVADEFFVCDLAKCKGACCVEGDLGAPLEEDELEILERIQDDIKPFLSEVGIQELAKTGAWVKDDDGDFSTPVIKGRECAYALYDDKGYLKCGIEQAYNQGEVTFKKPVSCHLYPIRVKDFTEFFAVNYDKWEICDDACSLGKELEVPVYKFVKEALIRRFGEDWYLELEKVYQDLKK